MQPASTEIAARTAAIIDELKGLEGPLLPILHGIQEEFGHVPQEALPIIAEALNLSRAEVHGVVTFYHDFREPAGRPACAEALPGRGLPVDGRRRARGADPSSCSASASTRRRADGAVTLEPVYCLGLCACAPSAMLDGEVHRPARRRRSSTRLVAEVRA